LSSRPSKWRRRRATMAAPKPAKASKSSGMQMAAIVIVALVALSGVYYFAVYSKPSASFFSERVIIQIGGAVINTTDPSQNTPATYYPNEFVVGKGAHVTLVISNLDNITHGLAVPSFNVDTGMMQPNATVNLSFVANPVGNYTFIEPAADCGGGNCDAGQSLNGTFTVSP
jgi:heme/copper-type cytochrome/quinol oxidase subunit 2